MTAGPSDSASTGSAPRPAGSEPHPGRPAQFLLVLRGPAGAGKSSLAKALRTRIGYPTAVVDTDLFAWEIVPEESNLDVRYEGLRLLVEHYLRSGYSVIVSGLILTFEDPGAMAALHRFADQHRIAFVDAFCSVSLPTAIDRNRRRPKGHDIDTKPIEAWWVAAIQDRDRVPWPLATLDLEQELEDAVDDALDALLTSTAPWPAAPS